MTVTEQNCTVVRLAAEIYLVCVHPDAGYLNPGSWMVFAEIVEHVKKPHRMVSVEGALRRKNWL